MGIGDIFKVSEYKTKIAQLEAENKRLFDDNCNMTKMLTPEMRDAQTVRIMLRDLENERQGLQNQLANIKNDISIQTGRYNDLERQIQQKRTEIIDLDDEILVQEFGLYRPHYDFANSLDYKEKLAEIRSKQKAMIKEKRAVSGNTAWQVNGSASQGKKMVSDTQNLLLRAFNTECDEVIGKVKYTNFDASLNRIYKSAETISKLGTIMNIAINKPYLDLKVKELRLAFEYQQKKQEEKEAQKAARAEMREAARLQKEIEAQRKKIEKEQTHYQTAYEKVLRQLETAPDNTDLLQKKSELETQLQDIDKAIKDGVIRKTAKRGASYCIIYPAQICMMSLAINGVQNGVCQELQR